MWFKRNGTTVIFEFSSGFDSNYATFKNNDTVPISLQCCGGLGRILKGGCGSNFAAGVIAANDITVDSISRSECKTTFGSGG